MCVGCGGRWVDEGDLKGMTLVQEQSQPGPQSTRSEVERGGAAKRQEEVAESPRSRKRRELYEEGERMVLLQQAKVESQVEAGVGGLDKGKSVARYDDDGDDEMDNEEDIEQEGDGRAQPVESSTAVSYLARVTLPRVRA
jgi:Zn-finger nucleic acid-binding protein